MSLRFPLSHLRCLQFRYFWLGIICWGASTTTNAQTPDSIALEVKFALNYLEKSQCAFTIEGKEYAGEWPAFMQMHTRFFLLGTRHKYRDSNSFTTIGIHNLLAEMYLSDTALQKIRPMLLKAYPEICSYATDLEFNFWKKLPPDRKSVV